MLIQFTDKEKFFTFEAFLKVIVLIGNWFRNDEIQIICTVNFLYIGHNVNDATDLLKFI